MSILFSQERWGVVADVQVLLADQGHAARDKNGGMRVSEVASNYNKSLVFFLKYNGGIFDVISNKASRIVIETSWFRLSDNGCGEGGIYSTLDEDGRSITRYKSFKSDSAECQW
ncbi:hypothetical protein [Loktanella sp. R86503]|uniref:hypothetical protein n=1 Tax=Loktanella sp. R86503 TaxID=3093847 RepID=UPI0036D8B9C4